MDAAKKRLEYSNYLICNEGEQKEFYRHCYKSYKSFTRYTKSINFTNPFNFGETSKFKFDKDGKYGDIITNITLLFTLPDISATLTDAGRKIRYSNSIGINILDFVEIKIGGNSIEKQSPEIIDILSETYLSNESRSNFDNLVGKYQTDTFDPNNNTSGTFYLPLQFWFCRNQIDKQMNLPLYLLYNSEVEITMKVKSFQDIITNEDFAVDDTVSSTSAFQITDPLIVVEYLMLEEEERIQKIKDSIKTTNYYLISQIQEIKLNIQANTINFDQELRSLKYLITQLFWVYTSNNKKNAKRYLNYNHNDANPIKNVQLKSDKNDVTDKLPGNYFVLLESYLSKINNPRKYIHSFSFSIDPKILEQPSGICNFSKITNSEIKIEFVTGIPAGVLQIFAVTYNVLQINNGIGTLLHNLSSKVSDKLPGCS